MPLLDRPILSLRAAPGGQALVLRVGRPRSRRPIETIRRSNALTHTSAPSAHAHTRTQVSAGQSIAVRLRDAARHDPFEIYDRPVIRWPPTLNHTSIKMPRRRPSGAQRRKRTAQRKAELDPKSQADLTGYDTGADDTTAPTPATTPAKDVTQQRPAAAAAALRAHDEAKGAPSPSSPLPCDIDVVKSKHLCQLIGICGPNKPVSDEAPSPSAASASPTTSEVVGFVEGNEGPADGSLGGQEEEAESHDKVGQARVVGVRCNLTNAEPPKHT